MPCAQSVTCANVPCLLCAKVFVNFVNSDHFVKLSKLFGAYKKVQVKRKSACATGGPMVISGSSFMVVTHSIFRVLVAVTRALVTVGSFPLQIFS